MTNPFNRADKHGAPDMRPIAPPSAETPMQPPVNQTITLPSAMVPAERPMRPITIDNVQFMTAAEQVEHGHRTRGEPTYAELLAINADLLDALEGLCSADFGFTNDEWDVADAAIARARGIARRVCDIRFVCSGHAPADSRCGISTHCTRQLGHIGRHERAHPDIHGVVIRHAAATTLEG